MGKTKAHVRYKLANGDLIPGVTTVLSILNKPALVKWSNNLGLNGIDVNKFVDALADIGTLTHKMIEDYLNKKEVDYARAQAELIEATAQLSEIRKLKKRGH